MQKEVFDEHLIEVVRVSDGFRRLIPAGHKEESRRRYGYVPLEEYETGIEAGTIAKPPEVPKPETVGLEKLVDYLTSHYPTLDLDDPAAAAIKLIEHLEALNEEVPEEFEVEPPLYVSNKPGKKLRKK